MVRKTNGVCALLSGREIYDFQWVFPISTHLILAIRGYKLDTDCFGFSGYVVKPARVFVWFSLSSRGSKLPMVHFVISKKGVFANLD